VAAAVSVKAMTPFYDLFLSHRNLMPGEQQRAVEQEFPAVVARTGLRWWSPDSGIPASGTRLVIGVATWSGYDMRLLDIIAEAMSRRQPSGVPVVEVFNTADCREPRDFARYVPMRRSVSQTPVVGVWRDGQLEWSGQGYEARDRAARLFGSGAAEIGEYVRDWLKSRLNRSTESA
jgi:hypothetical protein